MISISVEAYHPFRSKKKLFLLLLSTCTTKQQILQISWTRIIVNLEAVGQLGQKALECWISASSHAEPEIFDILDTQQILKTDLSPNFGVVITVLYDTTYIMY